jgi:hypothetical protein
VKFTQALREAFYINQDSSKDITQFYRIYSRVNMKQIQADGKTQNWSAIFDMTDPGD